MRFTKMHGLGNDYIYINTFRESVPDPAFLARRLSDRHTGIGADGLILIGPSQRGDVRMEMYNADGSRSPTCGNGIRCVAKYAVEHELAAGPQVIIETDAGLRTLWCRMRGTEVISVRVDMGTPILDSSAIPTLIPVERVIDFPLEIDGTVFEVTCVSMGNPHAVVFMEKIHTIDLVDLGPRFEYAAVFPERINTHFARVDSPGRISMRTWERGSGATRACGSGACAVCVAGVLTGRTDRDVVVALPGGELHVEWTTDGPVQMTGPAVEVFEGEVHLPLD
ncbi:MAG: diaminopimelate epimerase [Phycisphaerae bacterium]|nr:diaminopimelate epimerase [Phycisphaerae bacterium]